MRFGKWIKYSLWSAPILVGVLFSLSGWQVTDEEPKLVVLQAIEGLKYDTPRFAVLPGQRVRLIFQNSDEMAHNVVFTAPNQREAVLKLAADLKGEGPTQAYVPASDLVIIASRVLAPEESDTLEFVAPEKEGVYPYVCTYPGHGYIMYGAMYVTSTPMPPIETDPYVPDSQRNADYDNAALHPYLMQLPAMYRTFMPEAGPAAIAVCLPGMISYCWDAGTCQLRYVWKGGFVDNGKHWKGNGNAFTEIVGDVFYRNAVGVPIRLQTADSVVVPQFKGYRVEKGYPIFKYQIGQVMIEEAMRESANGAGIESRFTLSGNVDTVFYLPTPTEGVKVTSDKGVWQDHVLTLSPKEAQDFTISIQIENETVASSTHHH